MFKYILLSFLTSIAFYNTVFGQEDSLLLNYKNTFNQQFGLDILLYSGQYYYPATNIVEGTPFWENKPLIVGDIYIKGQVFNDCRLRYHMYLGEFILVFTDQNGAEKQIIIDSNKIDSIKIRNTKFIPNPYAEIHNKYLQVLSEGELPCFISWHVEKNFITTGDNVGYHYLNNGFDSYVYYNGQLLKIKKQKDLLAILPERVKTGISGYRKTHKVRWRKMKPYQLQLLIRECEKYME